MTLLRAALVDDVFWDDDLAPGELWHARIRKELSRASQLFVFWCAHAEASPHVRDEYSFALSKRVAVIPVLLDGTPMPENLGQIHGIDLQAIIKHEVPVAVRPPRRPGNWKGPRDGYRGSEDSEGFPYGHLQHIRMGVPAEDEVERALRIARLFAPYLDTSVRTTSDVRERIEGGQ